MYMMVEQLNHSLHKRSILHYPITNTYIHYITTLWPTIISKLAMAVTASLTKCFPWHYKTSESLGSRHDTQNINYFHRIYVKCVTFTNLRLPQGQQIETTSNI